MKLKLNALYGEEQDFQFEVTQEWLVALLQSDVEQDTIESQIYAAKGPMNMQVWVHRNEEDVFFRASLVGDVHCMCVRCLEYFQYPLELAFQGIFITPDQHSNEEPDDPFTYFFDGDEIDFAQPVRENLFLELPNNPSCEMVQEECTGEPLQTEDVSLESDDDSSIDPRWAALQQIKSSLKN